MKCGVKLLNGLMDKVPDIITGKTKEYEKELYLVYGNNYNPDIAYSMKVQNLKRYLYIIATFILVFFFVMFNSIFNSQNAFSVDKSGHQYIERPTYDQGNVNAKLIVSGEVNDQKVKKAVTLNIKPEGADSVKEMAKERPAAVKEEAIGKLNSVIYNINKSDDSKLVYLPVDIEGMENVRWTRDTHNPLLLITVTGGLLIVCTYAKRYDAIKKLKRNCHQSIEEELPDFLNKIILLMNAGLVLNAAFEKIVKDYSSNDYRRKSYFYNQLFIINHKVTGTNASMVAELKKFAERSKNREFMRITNVISDNIQKGTELVRILQDENSFLWFQRKKYAEEKGRIAETKLTMPLALQLVVLIVITLAPAMIEM